MLLTAYMLCFTARHFVNMDNQNHHVNTFINNRDFTEKNNLTYLLGNEDSTEEIAQVELSSFIDTQGLCEKLYTVKSNLSIVSLNAQSIPVLELGGFVSQFATHFSRVANQFSKWFAVCESFYEGMDCIIIHLLLMPATRKKPVCN